MIAPRVTSACSRNESIVDGPSVRRKPSPASRSRPRPKLGNEHVNPCCPDDSAEEGPGSLHRNPRSESGGASVSGGSPRTEFYIIARLDAGDSAADIYRRIFDVPVPVRHTADWAWSLPVQPGTAADLDGLDRMLAAAGYRRSSDWRKRITTSGAVRYFADATTPSHASSRTR